MPGAVFLGIFLIHLFFIIWVYRGLTRLLYHNASANQQLYRYSVIVAAHNEGERIAACLEPLVRQKYPRDRYEIVVVLDRCQDHTAEVVRAFQAVFPNFTILEITEVPEGVSPKKHAIRQAILAARYERLLMLDADVVPGEAHIHSMNHCFEENTAAVVSLMKFFPPRSFWQRFLVFEKLLSWCIAGAGIGWQRPVISYGGNWGYRKQAFERVNGFNEIEYSLSGDDDLLLQKMGEQQLPLNFCLEAGGWIHTLPPPSLRHFLRQRRRHFSAGKKYRFPIQAGYVLYHASNLVLWFSWLVYWPAVVLLTAKLIADVTVVQRGGRIFQERISPLSAVIFDFFYVIYNTVIGPLGHLGKVKW